MTVPLLEIPHESLDDFGERPVLATHHLHQHELFTDQAMIALLDAYPRQHLYALTMGTDDSRTDQNRLALHDGVSGACLLRAVKSGRLWLNVTQLHQADHRYGALIGDLYAQLRRHLPGFQPDSTSGTLLISSPHVLVYYHADARPSVLWHLRGQKRIWIYPALDQRFMARNDLEDIYAGVRHEYLPFDPSYDQAAAVYDLQPGQWLAWPANAPHRITNLDSVNVSLSTEHYTPENRARARIYTANRFLRTRLGMRNLSAREHGIAALFKVLVHRASRTMGLDRLQLKRHTASLRVDPDAPGGVVALQTLEAGTRP